MSNQKMDYKQALSKDREQPPQVIEPRMVLSFSYGKRVVMPYKTALKVLACLEEAETINEWGKPELRSISNSDLTFRMLSAEDYQDYRIAALLDTSMEEIISMKAQDNATNS